MTYYKIHIIIAYCNMSNTLLSKLRRIKQFTTKKLLTGDILAFSLKIWICLLHMISRVLLEFLLMLGSPPPHADKKSNCSQLQRWSRKSERFRALMCRVGTVCLLELIRVLISWNLIVSSFHFTNVPNPQFPISSFYGWEDCCTIEIDTDMFSRESWMVEITTLACKSCAWILKCFW